jgi:hypothetical protein
VDRDEDQARRPVPVPELARRFAAQMPACHQYSPLCGVLQAAVAGTNRASPPRKEALMAAIEIGHGKVRGCSQRRRMGVVHHPHSVAVRLRQNSPFVSLLPAPLPNRLIE